MKKSSAVVFGIAIIFFLTGSIYWAMVMSPKGWTLSLPRFGVTQSGETINDEEWGRVVRAVDGDTIELENGDKVRYVGINAPESVDPRRKVECFGKEASVFNRDLVAGKSVRLEKDISNHDKYGRLLRFMYLEDGTLVNESLVREGYAYASPYVPDISRKDMFREAESDARMNARGLWSPDTCNGKK